MISFTVFILGLAIGSFLNAVVYRLGVQEGLHQAFSTRNATPFKGRSLCPLCGHTLSWPDLVPLVSFVWLKGKCRYCRQRIPLQYPLVELATGIIFIALFLFVFPVENLAKPSFPQAGQLAYLVYVWTIASALVVVFVYDLKHFLIPDRVIIPAIVVVLAWRMFEVWSVGRWEALASAIVAGVAASTFFLAIFLLSRGRAMGFGDVKLALLMGLLLGWPAILVALFAAFCLGAVFGTGLILLKKKTLRSEVPFGPFLIAGTVLALLLGNEIVRWYLSLVLI